MYKANTRIEEFLKYLKLKKEKRIMTAIPINTRMSCFSKKGPSQPAMPNMLMTPKKEIATVVAKRGMSIAREYCLIVFLKLFLSAMAFNVIGVIENIGRNLNFKSVSR